jgi:hypothetical protein
MQVREAYDDAMAGVAEAGRFVIEALHIRAQLDHAKRNRGAHKGVAAPVHADEGIDVVGVIGRWLGSGCLRGQRSGEEDKGKRGLKQPVQGSHAGVGHGRFREDPCCVNRGSRTRGRKEPV